MNNQHKKGSHQISSSVADSLQHPHINITPDIGAGMNYAQMFASTGVGILVVRTDGIIEWTNQETASILRYESPQNVINKSVQVFLAEPAMAITWLRELEKSGIIGNAEVELKRQDGSKAHVLANAILHHNPQGELLRIGIIIINLL